MKKLVAVIDVLGGYHSPRKTVMCEYTNDFKKDCESLIEDFERVMKTHARNFEVVGMKVEKNEEANNFSKHKLTLWTYQGKDRKAFDMVGTIDIIDTYVMEV